MSEKQFNPVQGYYREHIGGTEYQLPADELDVIDDVRLWSDNPRLIPYLSEGIPSEDEMEATLMRTNGYDALRKSIDDLGQLEPIYVWPSEGHKYLVIEGATRVTVLRDLSRRYEGKPNQNRYRRVKVKVLPPRFFGARKRDSSCSDSCSRIWCEKIGAGMYRQCLSTSRLRAIRAQFSLTELAAHMGKSASWASRLRDAYKFAKQFVEFVDDDDAQRLALNHFSTLEEISKATGFGARVKANTADGEQLRGEVFDMVRHDVFKEYRDARHMAQYYDDPEKWEVLKSHERHAAHNIANQLRAGQTGVNGKISGLHGQLERALERDEEFDDEMVDELQRCVDLLGVSSRWRWSLPFTPASVYTRVTVCFPKGCQVDNPR